jgi:hypothetical protein
LQRGSQAYNVYYLALQKKHGSHGFEYGHGRHLASDLAVPFLHLQELLQEVGTQLRASPRESSSQVLISPTLAPPLLADGVSPLTWENSSLCVAPSFPLCLLFPRLDQTGTCPSTRVLFQLIQGLSHNWALHFPKTGLCNPSSCLINTGISIVKVVTLIHLLGQWRPDTHCVPGTIRASKAYSLPAWSPKPLPCSPSNILLVPGR